MSEQPLTDEQEAALRSRARQIYLFHINVAHEAVLTVLRDMVLPGGRLGESVAEEVRVRIAQEERPKENE